MAISNTMQCNQQMVPQTAADRTLTKAPTTSAANDISSPFGVTNQPPLMSNANTRPTTASADAAPTSDAMLQQIVTLVAALIQDLKSGNTNSASSGSSSAVPTTSNAIANNQIQMPVTNNGVRNTNTNTGIKNSTTNATQKAQLDNSLSKIGTDPDGAKLLAQAQKLGVTIKVGDPAAAAGANDVTVKGDGLTDPDGQTVAKDGTVVVNGVTLSDNNTGKITIVVRDPSNIKTIAHEMVHAVSTGDGNSKQEEGIADVVGSRIADNVGDSKDAVQGTEEQIYENKQQFYPSLNDSNNIRNTLSGLGINVSV